MDTSTSSSELSSGTVVASGGFGSRGDSKEVSADREADAGGGSCVEGRSEEGAGGFRRRAADGDGERETECDSRRLLREGADEEAEAVSSWWRSEGDGGGSGSSADVGSKSASGVVSGVTGGCADGGSSK